MEALRPGSPVWDDVTRYHEVVHTGLEEMIHMFCDNVFYDAEYQDLWVEILDSVDKVVLEATSQPFDYIANWVIELSRNLADGTTATQPSRFALFPAFVDHLSSVSQYCYMQSVTPTTRSTDTLGKV